MSGDGKNTNKIGGTNIPRKVVYNIISNLGWYDKFENILSGPGLNKRLNNQRETGDGPSELKRIQ